MTAAPTLQIDEVAVPADLAIWLDADMHAFFHELPRSQKRRYVDRIEQARTPDARERRIAATVESLRATWQQVERRDSSFADKPRG